MVEGRRAYLYGHTRKEVQEKLRKAQREQEDWISVSKNPITLKGYLEQWLEIRQPALKATTFSLYRFKMQKSVIPELGSVKLQKLTGMMIQHFYSHLLERGISPNTVRLTHVLLTTALDNAVRWRLLASNPCKGVIPPRAEKREMKVLGFEEAQRLLKEAQGSRVQRT